MHKPSLERAVDGACEAVRRVGSQRRTAKILGVSRQAIGHWMKSGVPPERVLALEGISGVSRYELRPDIYGPAPAEEGTKQGVQCAA
jgi:DNA-binding transcriptional regulator YdaS (Cro superfamily)